MTFRNRLGALTGFACLVLFNVSASADVHAYTDGPVVSVSSIRTADGKFDDYMKFVDTNWKLQQEAAKKAGDVLSYQVSPDPPATRHNVDAGAKPEIVALADARIGTAR